MLNSIKSRLLMVFLTLGLLSVSVFLISFHFIQKHQEEHIYINHEVSRVYNYMLHDVKVVRDFFSNETINASFFETRQSRYLDDHRSICDSIFSALARLTKKDIKMEPGMEVHYSDLSKDLRLYVQTIDTIVDLILKRGFKDHHLEGRMRVLAHELENLSGILGQANILSLRRDEKDFIIRQDINYQIKFHLQSNRIKKELRQKSMSEEDRKAILFRVSSYESKFDSLVYFDKLIGLKNQEGLKKRIDLMAENIDQKLSSISSIADTKWQEVLTKTKRLVIPVWILFSAIGTFLAIVLSKRISRSIILLKERIAEFVESDFTKRTVLPIRNSSYEMDILTNHFSVLEQHIVDQMRNLKVKNKELEMFIHRASHDIRSPLASVLRTLEQINMDEKDKRTRDSLARASNVIESLNDIIEELSMTIALNPMENDIIEIDPLELTKKCINGFQAMPGFAKIVFRTNVKMENTFFSDLRLIKIILRNLLENSIKYQDPKSMISYIDVTFEELDNRMVKITITDNGLGIKKELQKNIFEIFFRGNDSVNGKGLGLYIVQNTLQKLKGAVKVKSSEGKGTSFMIYLPDATRKTNHAQRIMENKNIFPSREEFVLDYL